MATQSKNCACPSPEIVAIPGVQGATGAAGANGTNGVNAYTFTSTVITIPATNSTTTATVANVTWMINGQVFLISDGTGNLAHFKVTAIDTVNRIITIQALGSTGDTAQSGTIGSGASVTPSGVQGVAGTAGYSATARRTSASGGSQALTSTPLQALSATMAFTSGVGTTHVVSAYVRVDYDATCVLPSAQIFTASLYRVNDNATLVSQQYIIQKLATASSATAGVIYILNFPYTEAGTSDTMQIFVSMTSPPATGNIVVSECSITALRLS